METLSDVKRAMAERKQRLREACESATGGRRIVPVTPDEMAHLAELCEVDARRAPAPRPATSVPEWEWIRC